MRDMYGMKQLTKVLESSEQIGFNNSSRIVLMSDIHRGDGGQADTFAKNQNIYFYALRHYYRENFTYIELGDGDELWENRRAGDIVAAHKDVFWMLSRFYRQGRLYWIYGNHDMEKKQQRYIRRHYGRYFDERQRRYRTLLKDIRVHEGLVLKHEGTGDKIFLVHGHQVDFLNSALWKTARFLVRNLWRPLEIFGVNDPTSAAKNYGRKGWTEQRMIAWARKHGQMLVAGHTHRPALPRAGEAPYFNDGSCVHPLCITAIEITGGDIGLVKWSIKTKRNGVLHIDREVLAGPEPLDAYLKNGNNRIER